MKNTHLQSGLRENTASSRQHAPRPEVPSLSRPPETLFKGSHDQGHAPVSISRASEERESFTHRPLTAATVGKEGGNGEAAATVIFANASRHSFEPLIGCGEAAKLLGDIHVKTLQRYARKGTLPGYRVGGHWYFRASELDSWLRSRINSSCHPCRSNQEAK
jgi:excisionase family DNA binding protein